VRGFFRSVSLGQDRPRSTILQDILRLITLWFNHGEMPDVYEAMRQGMQEVSIDTWLDVLIQLIARLPTGEPRTDQLLHEILSKVGQAHPQALIYNITVAAKSSSDKRNQAACEIMAGMKGHSAVLVAEAELVSQELIRSAILWHEMWHEALDEASRLFFGEKNINGFISSDAVSPENGGTDGQSAYPPGWEYEQHPGTRGGGALPRELRPGCRRKREGGFVFPGFRT